MNEVTIVQDVFLEKQELPVVPDRILDKSKKVILTFYSQKQKFPSVAHISSKLGLPKSKISPILKTLCKENFIEKKGTRYYLLSIDGSSFRTVSILDKAKATVKLSPGMIILKLILLVIGTGAAYMSIYHSIGFLSEYYSTTKAVISAIIMIVFNIIAADLIVFFRIKGFKALYRVFSVILVLGTLFSMGSTVVGLYNRNSKSKKEQILKQNKEDIVFLQSQQKYNLIQEKKSQSIKVLEIEKEKLKKAMNTLYLYTPEMRERDPQHYKEINWAKVLAERSYKSAQEKFDSIIVEESDYISENNITIQVNQNVPEDAYSWIGTTISVDPDQIQFWMSCYPALFYDVISPIAFCVILFVTGESKKKKRVKRNEVRMY